MALVQQNGGTTNGSASIVTSLGSATTAGNTILIFANGAGTITTPSGFTSRSPQVNTQGLYLFEKLVASGNSSDTPTLTMSGAFNATWQIVEYSGITAFDVSSGNNAGFSASASVTTPSITPTTGARLLVAFVGATADNSTRTWPAGVPNSWTNSFVGERSDTRLGTTGSGRDSMVGGWADLSVTANGSTSYSTNATYSPTNTAAPASIIAAYKVTAGAGSQTLTPSKYTNTNTFYAPTVARGARTLSPSLFSNSNTFYTPLVKSRYTLTPAKYTDADSFYAATVARGTRTLSPSLYANPDTFYSATVGRGAVTLRPSLVSDGDTFYSQTVTQGPVTLRPGLFTDADAFYAPVVGRGSVTLHPTKYANPDTFYSPFIGAGQPLQPAKFTNTNSFFAPVVGRGSVSLTPSKYSNSNSFYGPTVRSVHALLPSLFSDSDIFYAPTISGGATGLEPGFFANQNAFFAALIRQAAGFVTNPLERLKMYTGSMGSVSNREDWIVNISLVGDDGTSFDLTGAEIVAYVCREGCSNNPVLSASLGNGIVLTDNYTMQWHFDESQMASLCPQQYGVFCRVERDGITTQLLSANIAIVEGGPA